MHYCAPLSQRNVGACPGLPTPPSVPCVPGSPLQGGCLPGLLAARRGAGRSCCAVWAAPAHRTLSTGARPPWSPALAATESARWWCITRSICRSRRVQSMQSVTVLSIVAARIELMQVLLLLPSPGRWNRSCSSVPKGTCGWWPLTKAVDTYTNARSSRSASATASTSAVACTGRQHLFVPVGRYCRTS